MGDRMKLTDHFYLDEFENSDKARDLKIDNRLPPSLQMNALRLAHALEEVRSFLGCSILLSSGYRCPALNKAIGSSDRSAHLSCLAADFTAPKFGTPYKICKMIADNPLIKFDQLIYEGTWVHLSIDPRMRRQLLTKPAGHDSHFINGIVGE